MSYGRATWDDSGSEDDYRTRSNKKYKSVWAVEYEVEETPGHPCQRVRIGRDRNGTIVSREYYKVYTNQPEPQPQPIIRNVLKRRNDDAQ